MGGSSSKSSLERAEVFAQSKKFRDLVEYALAKGVIIEIDGLTTTVKHVNSTSVGHNTTTWRWDDERSEELVYESLLERVQRIGESSNEPLQLL